MDIREDTLKTLHAFVLRATLKNATAEELAVLQAVARLILENSAEAVMPEIAINGKPLRELV